MNIFRVEIYEVLHRNCLITRVESVVESDKEMDLVKCFCYEYFTRFQQKTRFF